jgi:hypothetical protein
LSLPASPAQLQAYRLASGDVLIAAILDDNDIVPIPHH